MQAQVQPQVAAIRLDARSLAGASLCVLALFVDVLGWFLAIAGIIVLYRASMDRGAKLLLAIMATAPKVLFVVVRWQTAPAGLSFPFEPRTLATSSSLWAWSALLVALGLCLMFLPMKPPAAPFPEAPSAGRQRVPLVAVGLVAIAVAAVLLLGLTDGFHRIDDAGGGRWALRHAARGNVALFSPSEVNSIEGVERYGSRSGYSYSVKVFLANDRSFSVTTKSPGVLQELRRFAATANLPADTVHIALRRGGRWTNGASGFSPRDCVGIYTLSDEKDGSHSALEFWLDGGRLAGKETIASASGRHVRVLKNIKLGEDGAVEFEPGTYVEASQANPGGSVAFSFRWSSQNETGRFVPGGLELGAQKYRKQ
jgi:hypothetical protein